MTYKQEYSAAYSVRLAEYLQAAYPDAAGFSPEACSGSPVYPPARTKLAEYGINCAGKTARQLTNTDDFETTWQDVLEGCTSLLERLKPEGKVC